MEAIGELSSQVSKFVGALSDRAQTASSVPKWERKRPVIKADDAEGLMNELVMLENTYADLGCKTFKKKVDDLQACPGG